MRQPRRCSSLLPASLLFGMVTAWTLFAQTELAPSGEPPPLPPAGEAAPDAGKLPQRPGAGLLDDGNLFSDEERVQMESDLEDFRARTQLPLFVVTLTNVDGAPPLPDQEDANSREERRRNEVAALNAWSQRLLNEWTQDGPALIVVYEKGSHGLSFQGTHGAMKREEEMRQLFLVGDAAGKSLPLDSSAAQRLRALVNALTIAGAAWRQSGRFPDKEQSPVALSPGPQEAPAFPQAPVDFVLDEAGLISDQVEAKLKSDLIQFHSRRGFDLYVVTTASGSAVFSGDDFPSRILENWMPQRRGVLMTWNSGAAGATLQLLATPQAANVLGKDTNQKLLTRAAELGNATGDGGSALVQLALFCMETIDARASQGTNRGGSQGHSVLLTLAASLVVGSGMLFVWHRIREQLEGRIKEQFFFPDVKVHTRLGAPHGGGVVAGGSFRDKNPK